MQVCLLRCVLESFTNGGIATSYRSHCKKVSLSIYYSVDMMNADPQRQGQNEELYTNSSVFNFQLDLF